MPVCEKALWQRQHAKVAGRIYRQRRGLADDRFQRARVRGEPVAGTSAKGDERLEHEANRTFARSRRQSRARLQRANTPHMFVINPEGKIIYEGAIDSKASPNPADIPSSTNYVKVALDESMGGKPVSNANTRPYGCSVKYK